MKNVLLCFTIALLLLNGAASAQFATQYGDTSVVFTAGGGVVSIYNPVKATTATPIMLKWYVTSTNLGSVSGFPDIGSGVCDNKYCRTATTTSNIFQNG